MTFEPHVTAVCRKSMDIYRQLARAAKVTWGLNGEVIRTIYVAVIEPIVLYAASVWYGAVGGRWIRKKLDLLQRSFARKIAHAYRTVSLNAAMVLSRTLPIDLRIREAAELSKHLGEIFTPILTGL